MEEQAATATKIVMDTKSNQPPSSAEEGATAPNKMADMKNKFMSWTLNVIKETAASSSNSSSSSSSPLYGVGVELAFAQSSSSDGTLVLPPSQQQHKHQVIMIASLHPSGPAAKMGMRKGDVVIQVDDTLLDYDERVYTPSDVAQLVRGPEGTFVDVIVERSEDGEIRKKEFHLRRDPIVGIRGRRMLKSNSRTKIAPSPDGGAVARKDDASTTAVVNGVKKAETSSNPSVKNSSADEKVKDSSPMAPAPNLLDRLDSVLNEDKVEEKQRFKALVKEDEEQTPLSLEEQSEEKAQDDNDISSTTADNDQWELISERSGSAIVISLNGSFGSGSHFLRCASPSLLKSKFVSEEFSGESEFLEHIVLPTDTLQGLCLAYKVSATQLRMENKFSGNSLQMAPKKIKIPMNGVKKGMMIKTQDKTSKEFKLYAFVAEIPTMELIEAKAYLDLSNWDLEEALRSANEDIDYGWDCYNGSGFESPSITMFSSSVSSKPKDLTVQDIYDGVPSFEGDGVELKDFPKLNDVGR